MTLIKEIPNPLGSVPPIYTKGDTLYSVVVVARAPRDRASARRETRGEDGAFARCARDWGDRHQCSLRTVPAAAPGKANRLRVPPIYTKWGIPTYNLWVTGRGRRTGWVPPGLAPRDCACTRRKAAREDEVFARRARGFWVFAFNARSGAVPLLPLCGAWGCRGSAGVMSESELGVVFGKGLSGGRPALHSLGRLLRFSSLFHRLTLRIKLLPRPIPVLSYGFNC